MATMTTADALAIRDLSTADDYEQCVALQRETWGDDFRELVPPAVLKIVQQVGGLAAGAFDAQGTLAGFVFGLTGIRGGELAHWSHMLAVRQACRDRGLGQRLKRYQRDRLLAMGVRRMFWTYDPLVARNAHLNLNRLGVRVVEYVQDMYGSNPMSKADSVIGTDRFIVEWQLNEAPAPRDAAAAAGAPVLTPAPDAGREPLPEVESVHIEIPEDVQGLKQRDPAAAVAWRAMTRRAFQHYLARGYCVAAFARDATTGRCFYLVRRNGDD